MAANRPLRPGESEGNLGTDWSYAPAAGGYTNKTTDDVLKAAVSGKRNYITSITLSVGVVLANASEIVIKDVAVVLWRQGLAVNTFAPVQLFFDPPLRNSAVNTALNFAAITTFATGNVTINAQGYSV